MNDVLNTYLSLGLLDIGDDDSRLSFLRAAATDLAKRFAEEPREAIYHALTVFSLAPIADDSYIEAGSALESHWTTYRNRFKDDPREVLKPISFLALQNASSENKQLANALGYLLRTVPSIGTPTRDHTVLAEFSRSLDKDLENHAIALWSVGTQKDLSPIGLVQPPTVFKIDREALSASIISASGPNNVQNQAITGGNPNWPSGNAAWTTEFGKQLSEAIASNIEQALLKLAKEHQKQLNAAITDLNATLLASSHASSFERRTQMLWWEKSGYSSYMGKAYSDLPKPLALIVMVIEFHKLVGGVTPYSAEYFLRNTVQASCGSEQVKLSDLFTVAQGPAKALLEETLIKFTGRNGSKTLFEMLISGGSEASETKSGKRNEPLQAGNLAVRLFNELQALTLAQSVRQAGN
jgi:GTPase-associated system helical domain